jgi:hypothetical protein
MLMLMLMSLIIGNSFIFYIGGNIGIVFGIVFH